MYWFVYILRVYFGRFHTAGDGCWLLQTMLRRQEQSLLAPRRWGLLSLNNPSLKFLSFNIMAPRFLFGKFASFSSPPNPMRKENCGDTPLAPKGLSPLGTLLLLSNWH